MKKSDQTKFRIIQGGISLFSKQGYGNTSTKDIAEIAEVSEATLFKYFKSKDGLFKAIIYSLVEELKKISIFKITPLILVKYNDKALYHTLNAIIDNRLEFLNQHDSTIKAIVQEAFINPELKELIQSNVWHEIYTTLEKIFNKAIIKGEIQKQEAKYLISSFLSSITAPVIASYVIPSYDTETRSTYIKSNFEIFYNSISMTDKELSHD